MEVLDILSFTIFYLTALTNGWFLEASLKVFIHQNQLQLREQFERKHLWDFFDGWKNKLNKISPPTLNHSLSS